MADDIKVVIAAILKDKAFRKGVKGMAKDAEKGAKKIKKGFDSVEKKQGGMINSIKKLKLGYAIFATFIGGVFVGALTKAIQKAAQFEKTQITFTVLLKGNKAAADDLIKSLENYANVTPFLTDQVLKAGQTLLAFGTAAEDVQPIINDLGDISAATGRTIDDLAVIFGQIQGAGRLMGQDLLQLINFGFNPLQEISERTGESMVSLKKRMSEGAVSFDEVRESFSKATSEGGKFFGLTTKQSKSFLGIWSTLISNISLLGRAFGEKLLPFVRPVVELLLKVSSGLLGVADNADLATESLKRLAKEQRLRGLDNDLKVIIRTYEILTDRIKSGTLSANESILAQSRLRRIIKNVENEIKNGIKSSQETNDLIFVRNELLAKQKIRLDENRKAAKFVGDEFLANLKKVQEGTEIEVETEKEKKERLLEIEKIHNESITLGEEEQLEKRFERIIDLQKAETLSQNEKNMLHASSIATQEQLEEVQQAKRLQRLNEALDFSRSISSSLVSISKNRIAMLDKDDADGIAKQKNRARNWAIGQKAIAVSTSIIDGILAVGRAIRNPPGPPFTAGRAIAVGAKSVLRTTAIATTAIPSFAAGIDQLPSDTRADLHKDERVIPARLNVPGVSNEDFVSAALRGLSTVGAVGGNTSNVNNNESTNNDNRSFTFNGIRDMSSARNEILRVEGGDAFS